MNLHVLITHVNSHDSSTTTMTHNLLKNIYIFPLSYEVHNRLHKVIHSFSFPLLVQIFLIIFLHPVPNLLHTCIFIAYQGKKTNHNHYPPKLNHHVNQIEKSHLKGFSRTSQSYVPI